MKLKKNLLKAMKPLRIQVGRCSTSPYLWEKKNKKEKEGNVLNVASKEHVA